MAQKTKDGLGQDEAFLALANLGFPRGAIQEALSQLSPDIKDTQEKITQALKVLGK
jgi:Holliday junction resolvasome RuvABC DNA-binding subunit